MIIDRVDVPGKAEVGDDGWTPWEDAPAGFSTPFMCFVSRAHPCREKCDEVGVTRAIHQRNSQHLILKLNFF